MPGTDDRDDGDILRCPDAVNIPSSNLDGEILLQRIQAHGRQISDGTAKQMDCSEEACVISGTLVPVDATAPNARAATPGTPSMPRPSMVTSLCLRMAVTALITLSGFVRLSVGMSIGDQACAGMGWIERVANPQSDACLHQRADRLGMQDFRSVVGQLGDFAVTDLRQCLCMRPAMRGSVVMTPSTSVQIQTSSAGSTEPIMPGGIITAAASQRGDHAFGRCADKACCDGNNSFLQQWI